MSIRRKTMVTRTQTAAPALRRLLAGTTALTTAAVCGWLLTADPAWALPTDGTVVEGQAEIIYGQDSVTIQQGSDRVIIEWQTFDVGAHESITFIQPHELAAALNRVLSGDASQILGSLSANGQVFISNPAGVVFGPDANVDVASIVATSLDIMNDRFMAGGRLEFDIAGDPTAVVENRGTINASGLAALVGPGARNSGAIVAEVAVLGGGEGFALDYYGDGLVNFAITDPTTQLPVDYEGNPVEALVENTGSIIADGGQVILTADAAAGVIDNVINVDGIIQARTIGTREGQVVLLGGDEGTVQVAGTIDASGDDAGEAGGTVHVLGDRLELDLAANIDASGPGGGGTVLVGGAERGGPLAGGGHIAYAELEPGAGSGTRISIDTTTAFETESFIPTADITYIGAEATIAADATDQGNGGTVVAWADQETTFQGAISARGGDNGGDGGQVEVSGRDLALGGAVNVGALSGVAGTVTFDPAILNIDAAAAASFVTALNSGGIVNVEADNQINVNAAINSAAQASTATLNFRDENGNDVVITLNADITLGANQDLVFNGAVVLGGNRVLTADDATFNSTIDGAFGLTVNADGVTRFNAAIGGTTPLTALETDAAGTLVLAHDGNRGSQNSLRTTEGAIFRDPATLLGNFVMGDLRPVDAGGVTFGSTVDGRVQVLIDVFGPVVFNGAVGATTSISNLTVRPLNSTLSLNGGSVTTVGPQQYLGVVTLGADTVLTSTGGAEISFNGNSTGLSNGSLNGAFALTVNTSGATRFLTPIGTTQSLTSITTDAPGTTVLGGGQLILSGNTLTFNDAVTLITDSVITDAGNVAFNSTIDGAFALTVNAGGNVTFGDTIADAVGGTTALTALAVQSGAEIDVNAPVTVGGTGDITLFARTSIRADASIQNTGTGRTNLVAGWDGVTTDIATILATASTYGINGGALFIGDGSQTAGIAVGSRFGASNFAAAAMTLRGSTTTQNGFAQAGFRDPGTAGFAIDGAITIALSDGAGTPGNLSLTGGGLQNNYVQVGHGGADFNGGVEPDGNYAGDITIVLANDLVVTAGQSGLSGGSYAQLGHGGTSADGSHSGAITITQARDLTFRAGDNDDNGAYVQLGHGGFDADGSHGGVITISQARDLRFRAGREDSNHAQLGHGGRSASGNHQGDIVIAIARNLTFTALTGGFNSYVQLGHGGLSAGGNHSGAITIGQAANLTLIGGVIPDGEAGQNNYAQIGHGAAPGTASGTRQGNVDIRVTGETSLVNGNRASHLWLIGHSTTTANGISNADVTLRTGTLDFSAVAASTQFGITGDALGADFATKMIANLAGGTVTLAATNGTAGPTGGMLVASPFVYSSANALTLFSTTDIRFGAGVQNGFVATPGQGGAVNVVAGWDGTTTNITTILATPAAYGVGGGAIFIGDGSQAAGIAVGSRFGASNFAAAAMTLRGSVTTQNAFAQAGFRDLGTASFDINGAITIALSDGAGTPGNLTAIGGRQGRTYAQVGHGGLDLDTSVEPDGNYAGAITIALANDLFFRGGGTRAHFRAYAQLGHGGWGATGNHSGTIAIGQVGNVTFGGGIGAGSYAQLGHGGQGANGNQSGAISITRANTLSFIGGFNIGTYAQLGNGGRLTNGNHTGAITITQANAITLIGGPGNNSYAQLGHGGIEADGNHGGLIDVTVATDLRLTGRDTARRYALIGHGDNPGDGNLDRAESVRGDVTVRVGGSATLTNAFIGHLIDSNGTYAAGNTFVGVGNLLTADAASRFTSALQGNGGELRIYLGSPAADGVNAAALLNGVAHGAAQTPNNQGQFVFGAGPYAPGADVAGNFAYYTLTGTWNYIVGDTEAANVATALNAGTVSLDTTQAFTQFGAVFDFDGGPSFIQVNAPIVYDSANALSFLATGDVTFNASVQNNGAGAINTVAGWDGVTTDIAAILANPATYGLNSSIVIGSGTQTTGIAVGSRFGASNFAGKTMTLLGSNTTVRGFAQAGFRDPGTAGFDINGAITIALSDGAGTPGDLIATAGSQQDSYVQVGHGGIDIDYSTLDSDGNYGGSIDVVLANDLTFTGGGIRAYAQLGNGGFAANGNHTGTITITRARDLTFTGGGLVAYAQLGHGGGGSYGNHSNTIAIIQARDLTFTGGGDFAHAQLGHGGSTADGNHSGGITITQARNLTFTGGSGSWAYAQLGHGGRDAGGNHSGAITIAEARDVTFAAGALEYAYAQLGHGGGNRFTGDLSGTIDVTVLRNLTLTGQDTVDQYAVLGHGDRPGDTDGDAGNTVSGNVTVRVGGTAALTNAFIGHLIDGNGTYTGGNTIVGAGIQLTADAASRFNSAPQGNGGELRIYVASAAADGVNAAALLNGVAHGAARAPNNQGQFAFGTGPYNVSAAPGNFAYYTLPIGNFNYIVDTTEAANIVTALGTSFVALSTTQNQPQFGAFPDLDGDPSFIRVDAEILYNSANTLNFIATGDVTFNASVRNAGAGNIGVSAAVANVGTGRQLSTLGGIGFQVPTVNLDGDLTAGGLLDGNATVVNVLSSTGGAQIQDAISLAAAFVGANINIAAGTYASYIVNKANLTVSGVGAGTIINTGSPAVTVAANGVTVRDQVLQHVGTPGANDIGILLDGTAAPGLTGVQIINVDFSNLQDGIRSQGDIGDGNAATVDVTIRGNSNTDRAVFRDFVDAAIDVGDTDGDAVYLIRDLTLQDGADVDAFVSGGDGIRLFSAIGAATIKGIIMLAEAGDDGIDIAAQTNSAIQIGGLATADANTVLGNRFGILTANLNGGSFVVANNTLVRGTRDFGILTGAVSNGAIIGIVGNAEIRGVGNDGILVNSIADSTLSIAGNTRILSDATNGIGLSGASTNSTVAIGPAFVTVDGVNTLFGGNGTIQGADDGLDIDVINGGTFTVALNGAIRGIASDGIEVDKTIRNGALFAVAGNTEIRGGDGVGVNGNYGIAVVGADTSTITIAGNTGIFGGGWDGIGLGGILTNTDVVIGPATVTVNGTPTAFGGNGQIVGGRIGVFAGSISGGTFTVANNALIRGNTANGINVNSITSNALFAVAGNTEIRGGTGVGVNGTHGIAVVRADTSTITIAGNNGIFGGGGDGILLSGILANTDVVIGPATVTVNGTPTAFGGNGQIVGRRNGIFANSISGGTFTVANNTLIRGSLSRGINVNRIINNGLFAAAGNTEIRGSTYGLVVVGANTGRITIAGNTRIFGDRIDGIRLGGTLINTDVVIGPATVTVNGTPTAFGGNGQIVGRRSGIFVDNIIGGSFAVAENPQIRGNIGTGIRFQGRIGGAAAVTIDRNGTATQDGTAYDGTQTVTLGDFTVTDAISGGAGGIGFGSISQSAAVTVSRNMIDGSGGSGISFNGGIASTQTTAVHNNFIQRNGGNGIQFGGDIASRTEIFQNFIARNGGDGVLVGQNANIGIGNLLVQVNFLPGTGFANGNGGFAYNQLGVGSPNLEGNWWGTPGAGYVAAINGVAAADVPTEIVTVTGGDDTNVPPAFANTPFEPFAFQPGTATASAVDFLGFTTDVETLLDEIRSAESQTDRPGGATFFTNELGAPFQTSVFTEGFAIGELQPAAGGERNGPVNLADLEPAAGPGSEQAQAEDTCVETYFGDFWNVESACQ